MNRKLSAALAALLTAASLGVASAPALAAAPNTVPTSDSTPMAAPISLAGRPAAPAKKVTGGHHGLPPVPGQVTTMSAGTGFHYAYSQETPASSQTLFRSTATVPHATLPAGAGASHTLMELSTQASNTVGGPVTDNIIEFGAVQEPNAFGDTKTRLFASCWLGNVWQGSYTGACGYVDNPGNPIDLGSDLSTYVASSKLFAVNFLPTACGPTASGWWLQFDTAWVGCFPVPGGAGRFPATFTAGKFFQAFGEVYKANASCIGMGNDLYPATTTTPTAFFSVLTHVSGSGTWTGSFNASDPAIWGSLRINSAAFRLGGLEPSPC